MAVESATLLKDSILFIRDYINTNITDPISASRGDRERFCMTSFPERNVKYPIVTVTDAGVIAPVPSGLQSNTMAVVIPIEIRIWARNVKERDYLFQEVYESLRTAQHTATTGTIANGLYDFDLSSTVNVDEPGEAGIKSKVMTIRYLFVAE